MTNEQKQQIIAYLSGPRIYSDGAALYRQFGVNLRLKHLFTVDNTLTTHEILFDELRKLAGLTEAEFRNLPRLATTSSAPSAATLMSIDEPKTGVETSELKEAPEAVQKMIRFRDRFPFLNSPDCPDVLKVLVADMFTAYGKFKEAHARLLELGTDDAATAAADCEEVVNNYLANREIWDELEYYRQNGEVLGKAAKFREMEEAEDLSQIPDVELMNMLRSAAVQESKQKRNVKIAEANGKDNEEAAASLQRWSARKLQLKAEVERRKKK